MENKEEYLTNVTYWWKTQIDNTHNGKGLFFC